MAEEQHFHAFFRCLCEVDFVECFLGIGGTLMEEARQCVFSGADGAADENGGVLEGSLLCIADGGLHERGFPTSIETDSFLVERHLLRAECECRAQGSDQR